MTPHVHPVQINYEDTDHSGVVYHANYLKYFERAREHSLGVEGVGVMPADMVGPEHGVGAPNGNPLQGRHTGSHAVHGRSP